MANITPQGKRNKMENNNVFQKSSIKKLHKLFKSLDGNCTFFFIAIICMLAFDLFLISLTCTEMFNKDFSQVC